MRVPHLKLAVPALLASVLVACGGSGGSSGGSDMPVTITVEGGSATVTPGTSFVMSGSAFSRPKAMSTMTWSVTSLTTGAPAMSASNTDCANGTRSSRSMNGITESTWACDSVATAPAVTVDSTYRLTFTGVDSSGNTSTGYRDVTVTSNGSGPTTSPPVATTQSAVTVTSGDDVGLNCYATGGVPAAGNTYTYQWVVRTNTSGLLLSLASGDNGGVTFRAPAVQTTTNVTLQCRATDNALATGTADSIVTILPNGTVNAIANAGPTQSVSSNATVTLNATASEAPNDPVLYFKWTQTEGPVVALSNDAAATPTFIAPSVSSTTRLTFQLTASTASPANPATAVPSELATVSVYVLPQDPLTLGVTSAQVVQTGRAVTLTASPSPSGGTLYYGWTQVSGPNVTLGGANTATVSFISPDVVGSYVDSVFSVRVSRKPLAQALPSEIVTADVVVRTTP